jgi:hypothetical protein
MAKASLYPDFKEFLRSLNSAGARYLILGGYAVNYHGYQRATGDLDIWIAVDAQNALTVSKVLQGFGGFSAAAVAPEMFLEKGKIFRFGRVPVRVDLLTDPSGIDFDECYRRKLDVELDGVPVPMISLSDLRMNKKASGRYKDLADLENLPPAGNP